MASSSVVSAAQWIGSLLIQEGIALFKVEEQVQGLKEELEFMQQYLQDADARQEDNKEIDASVRQIRKLAYDAEDVIDTFILKVRLSNRGWLVRSAGILYKFPRLYQVREKIQAIQTSLKRVSEKLNSFGLRRDAELVYLKRQRAPSYPYDDNDGKFVVGLEQDFSKLLGVLTSEGKTHINIVSIVGMGGSGKTTLARKLYNHPYIRECFNCTAWVSVSQEWSTLNVLSEILREVRGPEATEGNSGPSSSTVPELVGKLRSALKKISYLVVLDDVWRREALEEILPALPLGNVRGGSKIIITTRNRDIIQFQNFQQNMYVYEPPPLSFEEGWELFHKIALSNSRHSTVTSFENLGKEMLKKCDGLPLAIVALAGILNMKDSIAEWHQVNEAVMSRVMDGAVTHAYGRVSDMLALSYNDLPYYLKPCFLYLSLFPEDYKIPVGMLTRMWIAEGLVSAPRDMSLSVEDAAMQHLEELSHRFMIQVVRTNFKGVIKAVSLHDLVREACLKKAKELSFLEVYVSKPGCNDTSALAIQPRRVALHSSTSFPENMPYLRSLTLLSGSKTTESTQVYNETLDLMIVPERYKLLRLLTLRNIRTVNGSLPTQIGSLLHLRYLEIRGSNITELPTSIGKLENLLVLDYRDVVTVHSVTIVKIPDVLWKLVLLRHLFLPMNCRWSIQGLKLSTILNLQTLWGVKQDEEGQWLSNEIPKLSNTVNKLKVMLSSKHELRTAFRSLSLMSDKLQTFHCELRTGLTLNHVEPICHRQRLHKLILVGQVEMTLRLVLPINLVTLKLKDSVIEDEDLMAVLGALSHLKLLKLSNAFVGTRLICNCGSFPQLEELCLKSLVHLQMWRIDEGAMPYLKNLEIAKCLCLEQFPENLKFVTTLQLFDFYEVPLSFIEGASVYGWSPSKRMLPSNYRAIIERADSPVDSSSLHKLYGQLTAGIFLDNKKQKYWLLERNNVYYNCFMVYASNFRPELQIDDDDEQSWRLTLLMKDGTTELPVHAEFDTVDLSSSVTYEIVWVVYRKTVGGNYTKSGRAFFVDECEMIDNKSIALRTKFSYESDELSLEQHEMFLNKMLFDRWVRVSGGEFDTVPSVNKKILVSLDFAQSFEKPKLLVKGVIIQPRIDQQVWRTRIRPLHPKHPFNRGLPDHLLYPLNTDTTG